MSMWLTISSLATIILVMESLYLEFGKLVSETRGRLKMNQAELAQKCGLGRASIAMIESGKQSVTLVQAYKIADGLNISLGEILPTYSFMHSSPLNSLSDADKDKVQDLLRT